MENIDEREIDAARFGRQVLDIWRELADQPSEVGQRLAVLLLFTELKREFRQLPWSRADIETSARLLWTIEITYDWLGLSDLLNQEEWRRVPQVALDELWRLVNLECDHSVMLKRLDFLVQQLGEGMQHANALSHRIESFVADFVGNCSPHDGDIVDLNVLTNGEIGVRINAVDAVGEYVLPLKPNPHYFEVCLRLHAHNVKFRLAQEMGREFRRSRVRFAYGFPGSGRPPLVRPLLHYDITWDTTGMEFVEWFLHAVHGLRLAVIVLPTSELRAKGWRTKTRMDLLARGWVVGVLEIPMRVSKPFRLSMLIVQTKHESHDGEPIILMNGRAVDGLRDEPLDRLAQFLSIPFISAMSHRGMDWSHRADTLGEALNSRARKMFGSDLREMPGFFRYVQSAEIRQTQHAVLDPSKWVPERESLVSSDLLDGRPVHNLLANDRRACCIYIIGNNGVGKSMLLRQLAKACGVSGRSVRAIASASSDRFDTKVGPGIDYAYLGARTSDTATQPRLLGRKLAELILTIHENDNRAATFNRVLELLSFSGRHYLLPETASSDMLESVRELGRDSISGSLKGWKLGFRKVDANSIVPFDHLSTGEQQVLLLTARLVAHAEAGVVFLVDEPETSLHVAWQRSLPQVFQIISQGFKCQMVIATHSPVLISTARSDDTFRFTAEGGILEEIDEQAASSVERVLFQGFNTYTGNNREVHERCAELVSRAIELANTSQRELLPKILEELKKMELKVAKSVPALGSRTTTVHLNLIRRAAIAVVELSQTAESEGKSR